MLIRISLGMLSSVFISWVFKKPLSIHLLVISSFFILLPLADWLIYLPLRKRCKLASHYIWYYPLVYVPIGIAIINLLYGSDYIIALFVINSLANFVHATFQTPAGLQWLYPFSHKSFSLYSNRLKVFSSEDRNAYLEKEYLKRGRLRTIREEFSDRKHPKGWKTIALLIISIMTVLLHFF